MALVKPDVAVGDTKAHDPSLQLDRKSADQPTSQNLNAETQVDPDLQRAQELVSLHYNVKVNHVRSGLDPETIEARRRVDEVMAVLA